MLQEKIHNVLTQPVYYWILPCEYETGFVHNNTFSSHYYNPIPVSLKMQLQDDNEYYWLLYKRECYWFSEQTISNWLSKNTNDTVAISNCEQRCYVGYSEKSEFHYVRAVVLSFSQNNT